MNTITAADEKELRKFVAKKAKSLAAPDGKTPLNPHRTDNLECTLWTIAVKAVIACDPAKSPLVPFVKSMVNRSAVREAAREFNRQVKAAENPWSDESLDAPITDEDGNETAFGDHVPESAEAVGARENTALLDEVLPKMHWSRQMALRNVMYENCNMEGIADFLGITRPTVRRMIDNTLSFAQKFIAAENHFTSATKSADRP